MTAIANPFPEFKARPLRPGDEAFVFSSFLRTMFGEPSARAVSAPVFNATWKQALTDVLETFDALVAHPEGEPDEIAGYIVWKDRTLAFLYVKRDPWRQMGVARFLLEASRLAHLGGSIAVLFPTERGMRLARTKGLDVRPCSYLGALALTARVKP